VLAVRSLCAPQRLSQVLGVVVPRRRARPPGQADLDLLQEPTVAVGIAERGERSVVGVVRRRAGDARLGPGVVEDAAGVVEDLADGDARLNSIA
jgi:hypothetical protein